MQTQSPAPARYTLRKLGRDVQALAPGLARGLPHLALGFSKVDGGTRVAVQLRMAKLLGCPVCLALFPRIGRRAGLDASAVEDAVHGRVERLGGPRGAAVAYVEAVLAAGGQAPDALPEAATTLAGEERDHWLAAVRMELIVHDVGLMFLPHSAIERAALS